jgi:hypothetical protein
VLNAAQIEVCEKCSYAWRQLPEKELEALKKTYNGIIKEPDGSEKTEHLEVCGVFHYPSLLKLSSTN